MAFQSKYIIIIIDGIKTPIVFADTAIHYDIATALGGKGQVVGAGFCVVDEDGYRCYGESTSLQIKSNNELDSKLLNLMLGVIVT